MHPERHRACCKPRLNVRRVVRVEIAGQHLPEADVDEVVPSVVPGRTSASTRAWNAAYVCDSYLTRSDTVSTRRRARRRNAGNSAGLVGTDSDI